MERIGGKLPVAAYRSVIKEVCKKYKLVKDIEKKILKLLAHHLFNIETDYLRLQRIHLQLLAPCRKSDKVVELLNELVYSLFKDRLERWRCFVRLMDYQELHQNQQY